MFCSLELFLGNSGEEEVRKLASVESSSAVSGMLSFIQSFSKHLLAVFCVRYSALHYIWILEKLNKVFKTSNSLVRLGKGRCESEETAAKIMFQVILIGALWL